jgi:Transposase, Mutator family
MSEALAAVFPETTLQTCIVHLIRHSMDFATWKERKPMTTALRRTRSSEKSSRRVAISRTMMRQPIDLAGAAEHHREVGTHCVLLATRDDSIRDSV